MALLPMFCTGSEGFKLLLLQYQIRSCKVVPLAYAAVSLWRRMWKYRSHSRA